MGVNIYDVHGKYLFSKRPFLALLYHGFNRQTEIFPKNILTCRRFLFTICRVQFHGGIAQLGERLNGIQEVSGSIPLISTKIKALKVL
jgi:hypothetical protein